MASKLLVVEDDIALQKVIIGLLQGEGFMTEAVERGSDALSKIERSQFDLVLLDLGLPDIQGEVVLQKIRENYPNLPVIILTAKSKPQEIADGLNLGADDYLPKPFSVEELLARINARIKNGNYKGKDVLKIADLTMDLNKIKVTRGSTNIDLTKTEFELLKFLVENAGKVVSREVILNHVWGFTSEIESRVIDIYIGYLRKKIDSKFKKKLIKNKRGFGYLLDV